MGVVSMKLYECVVDIKLFPIRKANTKQEFIDKLIEEYNEQCFGLLDIKREDIKEIRRV
jgi:hypothetical protein|tara:strand:+ start:1356 stop:1532 length:177 start_codon:yes stop_codon:yes gene_type:complete